MAYIVVVEDNRDVAEVVCDALQSEGHRCFVIRSKAGAERFFRRVRPSLRDFCRYRDCGNGDRRNGIFWREPEHRPCLFAGAHRPRTHRFEVFFERCRVTTENAERVAFERNQNSQLSGTR